MSIAVDASSPAVVLVSSASVTALTASFNPPACVLVATGWTGDDNSGENNTMTVTNNSTALTWNLIGRRRTATSVSPQSGWVEAWYANLSASRSGMTVTCTLNTAYRWASKVFCVTGADTVTPLGAQTEGSSTATSFTTTSIAPQTSSALGICVANDWNIASGSTTTQPTSSDLTTTTGHISTSVAGLAGYKVLGASGSAATAAISTTGAGPAWNYLWFEIRAASAGGGLSSLLNPPPTNRTRLVRAANF